MKRYKFTGAVVLSWILGLTSILSQAQDVATEGGLPPRTAPLEILNNPQDFAGRDVEVLCWVFAKEMNEGRCPVFSETGQRQGDLRFDISTVSEQERAYVSKSCVKQIEPLRCLILITGRVSVSDDGTPLISAPRSN